MVQRVVVTGGSGKAGRHIIERLLEANYEILNLDLVPLASQNSVYTLKTDLSQSGQVFNALSSHFYLTSPFPPTNPGPPDAVIHLAGYARNMLVPDNETFIGNVTGTYNVIEAACKLGVKKLIIASSVCVYGVTYANGDVDFPSFPIDEEVKASPMDAYALSKLCIEQIAQSFATRFGVDIYILRIGALIAPKEYDEVFYDYVHNSYMWKVHGWSYTDARDLGQMCDLGIQKSGLGYQLFNATNDTITNLTRTAEFLEKQCPTTPFTRAMGEYEAPMSNEKIKRVLGFKEDHHWHKYFTKWVKDHPKDEPSI